MKGKILVLLLVFVFLFASGCAEEDAEPTEESGALEASAEQQDNVPQENSGSGKDHIVRLEYYDVARPSELDISAGDTVSWWSGKRQGTYILVSEEGLFPNQELNYSVPYSYTFTDPGTYLFTVKDNSMNVTIRVS
ncbi:Cell surface lipoprotein [Methanosarcina horonobensis HB-1 = JCM 15518]|uniref:Cell surface lipoprotein n=1 Tax=Methanosarcina horonobensis HB-1 = JCM 15518 TaxID=1434110 RepID=A0A0E3SBT8_9EURY|nr:cell surface lipoprotein [Methanosarcina horonobensis]AKB76758.1 Cell surface lipoprotein [Methanosarcina horonobensis HB-1 = JCM 15518]